MVISETSPEPSTAEYQEPNPYLLKRVLLTDYLGREALYDSGYRINSIGGDEVVFEPCQEGVKKYPPVQVNLDELSGINRLTPQA
jgi:hypothetical protein